MLAPSNGVTLRQDVGPPKYIGRSMHESHQQLNITPREWDAFMDDLQQTVSWTSLLRGTSKTVLLLHYRYLNFEQTHSRHMQLATKLKAKDIRFWTSHKYSGSRDELREDWDKTAADAVDVRKTISNAAEYYPCDLWWSRCR